MTSGPSEEPPIPQRMMRESEENFLARASSWGSKAAEVVGKSTQFKRMAASAAAAAPQVFASFAAIFTCAFAKDL